MKVSCFNEHEFARSDFRIYNGNESFFDDLLESLEIPEDQRSDIRSIIIRIDQYEIES